MSIFQQLLKHSSHNPKSFLKEINEDGERIMAYIDILKMVASYAEQISRLIEPFGRDKPVVIILSNGINFCSVFLALIFLRSAPIAPLNNAYKQEEFTFYLQSIGPSCVLCQRDLISKDLIEACRKQSINLFSVGWNHSDDIHPNEASIDRLLNRENQSFDKTALLLHTSGTTSLPKLVPISHNQLYMAATTISEHFKLDQSDCVYLVMPLFHVHGLIGCFLSTIVSGGSIVLRRKFSASHFLTDSVLNDCTWYSAVPTIHKILLSNPEYLDFKRCGMPKFRFIRSCSSPLAMSTLTKLKQVFQVPVLESYGMTESTHLTSSNSIEATREGSVGKPYKGVQVSIRNEQDKCLGPNEVGQISLKGATVTLGYLGAKKGTSFSQSNWFLTGDEGYLDSDGFLFVCGRSKEMINKAGEKVNPLELDNCILSHPKVSEAVSFGLPDEMKGEEVYAAVVAKEKIDEGELRLWCQKKLAAFKVPKKFFIVDSIPSTSTGKIQRNLVKSKYSTLSKL